MAAILKLTLRDYQEAAKKELRRNIARGLSPQILCAPTGSGKTIIAASIIYDAMSKGSRIAFVADREALVLQTSRRLYEANIEHGIYMGSQTRREHLPVVVCSAQTLERRGWLNRPFNLIIVDEAHTQRRQTLHFIKESGVPVIGLTATPFTAGLGKTYKAIVNARTTQELMDEGWLTPLTVFCGTEIDMSGLRTVNGEWTAKDAEDRAIPIVGDIVSEWVKHTQMVFGGPVTTIAFSATVAHGRELCRQFQQAGYSFEQVSYDDKSTEERQAKIRALEEGKICGLISCEALAKGFDVPQIRCVISARPYRESLASHIQQIGRGMRSAEGKDKCLLMDHAGNYLRFAEDTEAFWNTGCNELDDGKRRKRKPRAEHGPTDRKCRECAYLIPPGESNCLMCGAAAPKRQVDVKTAAGEMVAYSSTQSGVAAVDDPWPSICLIAAMSSHVKKKELWSRAQYKEITGRWTRREFAPGYVVDTRVALLVQENYRKWKAKRNRAS